jgi:hypothetical protein
MKLQRVFSPAQFKRADRIERLYMKIMQPDDFELNNTDDDYLEALTQAYPLICTGRAAGEIIRQIQELQRGKWKSQAIKIYKDSQELYARFEEIHPKILRGIMRESLMKTIERMEEIRDNDEMSTSITALGEEINRPLYTGMEKVKAGEVIGKSWAIIGKFARLDREDISDDDETELPRIRFSTDPKVLLNQQQVQSIDFEELEND